MFAPFASLNSIRRRRKRNQSRSKSVTSDKVSLTPTTSLSDQMDLAVGDRPHQDDSSMVALHKHHSTAPVSDDDVNMPTFFPATDHLSSSSGESSHLHPTNASLTTSETSFSSTGSDFVLNGGDEEDSVSSLGEPKELEQLLHSAAQTYDFQDEDAPNVSPAVFRNLRITYLLVTLVIMLADGLQGTHLYVLYESYGFSVASLYCLGFGTGGVLSFLTGPLVDHMGRKKAALLYCALEIFINMLEQYPFFYGLVASRMIGGFTTNLLSTVFETWLDTEHRRLGLAREKYETILRDSVIVSNLAAIFSGYLASLLAHKSGPVGPFQGAVTCTGIALIVVAVVWTENYGKFPNMSDDDNDFTAASQKPQRTNFLRGIYDMISHFWGQMMNFLYEALSAFWADSHMLRVGISQGLTAGSLQIFVFLWSPVLRSFAKSAPQGTIGLDEEGEPDYGLIFAAFMLLGVLGGLIAPRIRRWVAKMVTPVNEEDDDAKTVEVEGEGAVSVRPMAVEVLASTCYLLSALFLCVPYLVDEKSPNAFRMSLAAFMAYELVLGIYLPNEGVIRSIYFPSNARASVMALPRLVVNAAVAMGVLSTNYISFRMACGGVGCLMITAAFLQISLVTKREWSSLFARANNLSEHCVKAPARRLSRMSSRMIQSMSSSVVARASASHKTRKLD